MTPPPARSARRDVVGLMPAAGRATRLPGLECSKEIYPIGRAVAADGSSRPKAVCEYLLEEFAAAGIRRAIVILRPEKRDIREHLGRLGGVPRIDYLEVTRTASVPHTLDHARPRVKGRRVALGFPDILVRPAGSLAAVLERQEVTGADLALGLFPTRRREKADMVALDPSGRVARLEIKRPKTTLTYTWSLAVWTARFTEFLHAFLAAGPASRRELYVGDVIQAWLDAGNQAEAVAFPEGDSLDIGTPDDLRRAVRRAERAGGARGAARATQGFGVSGARKKSRKTPPKRRQ